MVSFELGGVSVPYEAGDGSIRQTYASKHEGTLLLMGDGSSFKQSLAGAVVKVKTGIAASNMWAPVALSALDYTAQMLLKCAEPRSVYGATTSIDIPSNRRSDGIYVPKGYGIVDNVMVETPVSVGGDTAALDPVTGATSYLVTYWPEITVFAQLRENVDTVNSVYGWSLECEEV